MERRKITIKNYSDIIKCFPEFSGVGINEIVMEAYRIIFPANSIASPYLISLTSEQRDIIQSHIDNIFNLIENTPLLPNDDGNKRSLRNMAVADLPNRIQMAILTILTERDSALAGKYRHIIPGKPGKKKETKLDKKRKKAASVPQNVIYPASPQEILTQRRRGFINQYGGTPEVFYAAVVFYILDCLYINQDIDRATWGVWVGTILKLAGLMTKNAAKIKAATTSIKSRKRN